MRHFKLLINLLSFFFLTSFSSLSQESSETWNNEFSTLLNDCVSPIFAKNYQLSTTDISWDIINDDGVKIKYLVPWAAITEISLERKNIVIRFSKYSEQNLSDLTISNGNPNYQRMTIILSSKACDQALKEQMVETLRITAIGRGSKMKY